MTLRGFDFWALVDPIHLFTPDPGEAEIARQGSVALQEQALAYEAEIANLTAAARAAVQEATAVQTVQQVAAVAAAVLMINVILFSLTRRRAPK